MSTPNFFFDPLDLDLFSASILFDDDSTEFEASTPMQPPNNDEVATNEVHAAESNISPVTNDNGTEFSIPVSIPPQAPPQVDQGEWEVTEIQQYFPESNTFLVRWNGASEPFHESLDNLRSPQARTLLSEFILSPLFNPPAEFQTHPASQHDEVTRYFNYLGVETRSKLKDISLK